MGSATIPPRSHSRFALSVAVLALALGIVWLAQCPSDSYAATGTPALSEHCLADESDPTQVTCSFAPAGAYTLPVGPAVSTVDVVAVGAAGGTAYVDQDPNDLVLGAPGGRGARVTGTVPATSGTLYVMVGGQPVGTQPSPTTPVSGFNGGGPGGQGPTGADLDVSWAWAYHQGGGGGASDIRTVPADQPGTLESRLLVAGGGGGGGLSFDLTPLTGAVGGDAGQNGASSPGYYTVGGGGAGTAVGGGSGGSADYYASYGGYPGELGAGGTGGHGTWLPYYGVGGAGGGGGGGYFGGGGGAGSHSFFTDGLGGGGGGGGSNLVPAGGSGEVTSAPAGVTVNYVRAATTVALTADADTSEYGAPVALTATVNAGEGTADGGTVTFYADGEALGSAQDVDASTGAATLMTSALAIGSRTITAGYRGNASYAPSESGALTHSVTRATTAVALTADSETSEYGDAVALTATVSSDAAVAYGGTVTFYADGTALGGAAAIDPSTGVATLTTSALAAGDRELTAGYSGDATHAPSESATVAHSVTRATTAVALAADPETSEYGGAVTLTATVSSDAGAPDGGSVTFYADGQELGSAQDVDASTGAATLTTSALTVGAHTLTAGYGGRANYGPSESDTLAHPVTRATTTVALSADPEISDYGAPVVLTATVNAGEGTADGGTVTFYADGEALGSAQDVDASTGAATLTTSALAAGERALTASYSGDANYVPGESGTIAHSVTGEETAVALTADPRSSLYGAPVTLTATVSSGAGVPDGGAVTFYADGEALHAAQDIDTATGVAALTISSLAGGDRTLTASYSGHAGYAPSESASVAFTVTREETGVALATDADAGAYGAPVVLTATVSSDAGMPDGGTLTFYADGTALGAAQNIDTATGVATLTTSTLAAGEHTLTARYSGNAKYAPGESATVAHSVAKDTTQTALTATSAISVWDFPATLTATVTTGAGAPIGGSVQFYGGDEPLGAPVAVSGGTAGIVLRSQLSPGEHTLSAAYSGDAATTESTSGPLTHTALQLETESTLSASRTTVSYGEAVELTGDVTLPFYYSPSLLVDYVSIHPYDAGTVQLYDGDTAVGEPQVLRIEDPFDMFLELPSPKPSGGLHHYRIVYSGNNAFESRDSGSFASTVTVNDVPSATTVTSSQAEAALGQAPTLTATVELVDGRTATGTVQFADNGEPLGAPQPLGADGTAVLNPGPLAVGEHAIRATYTPGDPYTNASISATLPQPVKEQATSITLTSSPDTVRFGQPLTLDAHVQAAGPGSEPPTGAVTFSDGGDELGTAALDADGHATLDLPELARGGHVLSASYGGDSGHTATMTERALTVERARTTLTVDVEDAAGGRVLTAELAPSSIADGAVPQGTVAFYDGDGELKEVALQSAAGGAATARLELSGLEVGHHALQAVYAGDQNFAAASSRPAVLTVSPTVIDSGPGEGTTASGAVTFGFSSADHPGDFECRLDAEGAGDAWHSCTIPVRLPDLADGPHVFQVRAAGRAWADDTVTTRHFQVTPVTPVAPGPETDVATVAAPDVSGAEAVSHGRVPVGCRLDGGRLSACTVTAYVRRGRRHRRVGRGAAAFSGARSGTVKVKLTKRGRRLVGRLGGVRLSYRGVATTAAGKRLRFTASSRVLPTRATAVTPARVFARGSSRLTGYGLRHLLRVARRLDGAKRVLCAGYDRARAKAICAALKSAGVRARLKVRSGGGRAHNQRVELEVTYRSKFT
jgi:hypothetical protein